VFGWGGGGGGPRNLLICGTKRRVISSHNVTQSKCVIACCVDVVSTFLSFRKAHLSVIYGVNRRSFMWRPHASVHLCVSLYQRENRLSDFHEIWLRVFNSMMWSRCEFRENGCSHSRAVPTGVSEF